MQSWRNTFFFVLIQATEANTIERAQELGGAGRAQRPTAEKPTDRLQPRGASRQKPIECNGALRLPRGTFPPIRDRTARSRRGRPTGRTAAALPEEHWRGNQ